MTVFGIVSNLSHAFFSWLFFFCHDGTVFSYRTLMSIYFIHVSSCLFVFSFSCMLWIVMPLVLLWICFRVGSTVYTIIMRTVFDALQTHAYIHFSVCLEGCLRRGSVDNHPRVCINTRHRVSFQPLSHSTLLLVHRTFHDLLSTIAGGKRHHD